MDNKEITYYVFVEKKDVVPFHEKAIIADWTKKHGEPVGVHTLEEIKALVGENFCFVNDLGVMGVCRSHYSPEWNEVFSDKGTKKGGLVAGEFIMMDFGDGSLTPEQKKARDEKEAAEDKLWAERRYQLLLLAEPYRDQLPEWGSVKLRKAAEKHESYMKYIDEKVEWYKGHPKNMEGYIQIWIEGYAATGEHGTAHFCGIYKADTFDQAMEQYSADIARIYPNDGEPLKKNEKGYWLTWGCRYYDNEADARKSFG